MACVTRRSRALSNSLLPGSQWGAGNAKEQPKMHTFIARNRDQASVVDASRYESIVQATVCLQMVHVHWPCTSWLADASHGVHTCRLGGAAHSTGLR